MSTEVLKIETPEQFATAVQAAAELLKRGGIVAVPTETVYGLAANAYDEAAVRQIYEVKGRPSQNPIIVHVASLPMARECTSSWPNEASDLVSAFWPGPLTLVLRKSPRVPSIVTAGGDTVGIRWPAHPFTQAVIRACGFPIAAPSANLANQLSPSMGEHVARDLGGKIPLIVDAGPCSVGIESTVLDLTVEPPRVLRAGMISSVQIANVLEREVAAAGAPGAVMKSPGLLGKHYAPRAQLVIRQWRDDTELKKITEQFGIPSSAINIIAHDRIPLANQYGRVAIIPHDPEAYARALYAELHQCDELEAKLIVVEELPSGGEWQGIRDRLNRASATH